MPLTLAGLPVRIRPSRKSPFCCPYCQHPQFDCPKHLQAERCSNCGVQWCLIIDTLLVCSPSTENLRTVWQQLSLQDERQERQEQARVRRQLERARNPRPRLLPRLRAFRRFCRIVVNEYFS